MISSGETLTMEDSYKIQAFEARAISEAKRSILTRDIYIGIREAAMKGRNYVYVPEDKVLLSNEQINMLKEDGYEVTTISGGIHINW